MSPSGGSILITSAPMSPRMRVAYGPMRTEVRSRMRIPSNGADGTGAVGLAMSFLVRRQLGADKATGSSFGDGADAFARVRRGKQLGLLVALVTNLLAESIEETVAQRCTG